MSRLTTLALCLVLVAPPAVLAQHEHHTMPEPSATSTEPVHIHEIPDVDLLDQNGNHIRFFTDLVKGKTVAINFIFTSCTTICPALSVMFTRLQKEMPARIGHDVFLISVSIDPANDTPERLLAWGKRFGAKDGWTMVTGKKEEVEKLLKALGVYTPDFRNHQPVTLIGNGHSGMWQQVYGFPGAGRLMEALNAAGTDAGSHRASGGQR